MENVSGITSIRSPYSVDETMSRLEAAIVGKGLQIFAHIDHAAGAAAAGLEMQPAQVLIFGHAKAGTPLMIAAPLLALELPLKALVWEDAERTVWVSHTTTDFLVQRYSLPAELAKNIASIDVLVRAAVA